MRQLIVRSLMLACLLFGTAAGENATAQTTDKREAALVAREHAYFDAIIAKKYELLTNMLANDYLGTYRAGIIDKAHESKDLASFPLADYKMSETKTAFPAANTAIISFRLHVWIVVEGKDITEDDYLCCIWTRHGGRWLLSAQTAAKVME